MKIKHVWISETLLEEIKYTKDNLNKNKRGKSKITLQKASDELGKQLNKIRNSGLF
jgi:hypothetical protein